MLYTNLWLGVKFLLKKWVGVFLLLLKKPASYIHSENEKNEEFDFVPYYFFKQIFARPGKTVACDLKTSPLYVACYLIFVLSGSKK
jgi:hypothetical protein